MKLSIVQVTVGFLVIVSCVLAQKSSNTTTTVAPTTATTTTVTPSTTTTSPNTTTASSTTPVPSTTPASTTAAPTTPAPTEGSWRYPVGGSSAICMKLDLKAAFIITYNTTSGKTNSTTIDLPVKGNTVTVSGSCGNYNWSDSQWIQLAWKDAHSTDFSLRMDFTSTALVYRVENVTLEYILTNATFPEVANPGVDVSAHLLESVDFLTAQLHDSLQCTSGKEVQLHDAKAASVTGVAFDILNIQVQAYMNTTTNTFGTAENCEAPHNSDIVPIAVGCALAVLVIIVLVAYLIGRRRSRQQGYQSV